MLIDLLVVIYVLHLSKNKTHTSNTTAGFSLNFIWCNLWTSLNPYLTQRHG